MWWFKRISKALEDDYDIIKRVTVQGIVNIFNKFKKTTGAVHFQIWITSKISNFIANVVIETHIQALQDDYVSIKQVTTEEIVNIFNKFK